LKDSLVFSVRSFLGEPDSPVAVFKEGLM